MKVSFGQSIIRCMRAAPFGIWASRDAKSGHGRIVIESDKRLTTGNRPKVMKVLVNSVLVALLTFVTTACDGGEKSSTISGKILDKASQLPIDSAWVNTIDTTDGARYCDVKGTFSLTTFGRIQKFYAGKVGYNTRLIELPEDEDARQNVIVELENVQQPK